SYEYTYNGQSYKVGELSEDYQNRPENEVIFLRMLRPGRINTEVPTWDLMMKNIYNFNASQIQREGFQLQVIYRDDRTGMDNLRLLRDQKVKAAAVMRVMNLDILSPQNELQPECNFVLVPGLTIVPDQAILFFPVLQPYGQNLHKHFLASE